MSKRRGTALRRWSTYALLLAMTAATAAVVIAAILADGRPASSSSTHNGSAWLLNRDENVIGEVNRVVGEVSGVAGPIVGSDFEVDESGDVIVVHDRSTSQVRLVNPATHSLDVTVQVPADTGVFAADEAIVVHDRVSHAVWRLATATLGEVKDLSEQSPQLQATGPGRFVLSQDFTPVLFDGDADAVTWLRADGSLDVVDAVGVGDHSIAMTVVGESAVFSLDDGALVIVASSGIQRFEVGLPMPTLQQPSVDGSSVAGITADGQLVRVDTKAGVVEVVRQLDGSQPIDLIMYDGCEWAVTLQPSPVFEYCGQSEPLPGAGSELRLRLVNGWVWVNDATRGNVWFVDDQLDLTEVADWTAALNNSDAQDDTQSEAGGDEELVENPNADDINDQVDQLDDDDINENPQAVEDFAQTRESRATVVHVLSNDTDADFDPLVVDALIGVEAGLTPEGARVSITPDGTSIQVVPPVGTTGVVRFGYRVHDGRQGRDEASVAVEIVDPTSNRPPETVLDNATVRAGASVSLNVLTNDTDPDGDVLVLTAVDEQEGAVTFAPSGEVTYRPNITSTEGTVTIQYTVVDDLGAEATGEIKVRVRGADSNQKPIARNDIGITTVDHSLVLDVLVNDSDPDGDLLVAQNLVAVEPLGTLAQLTPDGIFSFIPQAAGTYRFSYIVSDGPETDVAQIRIDVEAPAANRPPTAIRDDLTIAVGETRLARVLDNDGDIDGDVVGIVGWFGVDGLEIVEVPGVGFNVTATPSAAARSVFTYLVSDGTADPVSSVVVVSVTPQPSVDLPPVARPDVIDVRAGQTTSIPVLKNDFDPDGGSLTVVGPLAEFPGGEATLRVSPDGLSLLLTVAASQKFGFDFGYDVVDRGGNRSSSTVEVRIVPEGQPNRAPIARPDVARSVAKHPVVVDVIINDSDPDGDPITVESIAEQPAHGTVELLEDGTIMYTPAPAFLGGTDRFSYTLVDGYSPPTLGSDDGPHSALGQVLIGVMPEPPDNRPPSAVDDVGFPSVQVGSTGVMLDVLSNDTDPDQDRLTITSHTLPAAGELAIVDVGRRISYIPPADGIDREISFSYSVSDGRGGADAALVTLSLVAAPEPVPPVALDDIVGPVRVGTLVTLDPRINDFDPDGPQSALQVQPSPDFVIGADGRVTLTATAGVTRVAYSVSDATGLVSDPAFITVQLAENVAPVVPARVEETPFETPITLALHTGVSDEDGDELLYALGRNSSGGSVRVAGSPAPNFLEVVFTPDVGFSGQASFDFAVDDQHGHRVSATVIISVLPPENRAPTATGDAVEIQAGVSTPIDLSALVTDADVDEGADDALTYAIGPSSSGEVRLGTVSSNGIVTVSSDVDAGGASGSFTFTVTDSFGEAASARIDISLLTASNYPPPGALADSARTFQASPVTVPVLDNDVDNSLVGLAGDGLVIATTGVSPDGTVTTSPDRQTIVFDPNPGFFGTTIFTYTVQDGRRSTAFATTAAVTIEVIGFPAAPQPPTIASVGNTYLVVTWQAPAGNGAPVDDYRLEYEAPNGERGSIDLGAPSTNHRWDGLTNGIEYRFRVTAHNEAGYGEPSPLSLPGVPDVRPEPPGIPTVVFGEAELRVAWSAALTQGTAVDDYEIEIGGGTTLQRNTNGAVVAYTWQGLDNGTEYQFRVRAHNAAVENNGWSEWSNWSTSEHPLRNPDAPATPLAQRGDGQVQISWSAPFDGGDAVSRYEVQRVGTATWTPVTPQGATNTHTWSDLSNGTPVQFVVRAVNRDPRSTTAAANVSAASAPVTPCAAPVAPATPGVVTGDQQVTVSWTPPASQGCAILDYTITASDGRTQTAPAGAVSHVFTGLVNGTPLSFSVTANNEVTAGGEMPPNPSPMSAQVVPVGPPFATSISSAPTGVGQIRLDWAAANGNGGAITAYEISVNGGGWTSVGTGLTYTFSGLANGTGYIFNVRGVNVAGPGASSAATGTTTWGVPGTPGSLATNGSNGRIDMSWSAPGSNGGTGITRYEAKVTTGGTCDDAGSSQYPGGSPATFTGLANGQPYRVCVRAENAVGWGGWAAGSATPVPPPSVSIGLGARSAGACVFGDAQLTGDLQGCYNIAISMANFPGTHTVRCYHSTNRDVWEQFASFTAGNGTHHQCSYSSAGRWVVVVVDGTASGTSPNPPSASGFPSNVWGQWPTN